MDIIENNSLYYDYSSGIVLYAIAYWLTQDKKTRQLHSGSQYNINTAQYENFLTDQQIAKKTVEIIKKIQKEVKYKSHD